MPQPDQIQHIINLLFQVDKAMHEQLRDADTKLPLSLPDIMALGYIDRVESASITDMAAHFGIRKSSVSVKIAKLELQGLVTRNSCSFDKRSHSIALTQKARSLLDQTKSYVALHANPLFSKLTDVEQQTFIQLLKKIIS